VETSGDFGTRGDRPSHPELLDWLATEFMDHNWDVKRMHKLIVMSATYRQSSKVRKELEARDPNNKLLARQSERAPALASRRGQPGVRGLREVEGKRRAGTLSPRLVHFLSALGALPAAHELQRAGLAAGLHAPGANHDPAPGAQPSERCRVCRGG